MIMSNMALIKRSGYQCVIEADSIKDIFGALKKRYPTLPDSKIREILKKEKILVCMPNTKSLSKEEVMNLPSNVSLKIGGYDRSAIDYAVNNVRKELKQEQIKQNRRFNSERFNKDFALKKEQILQARYDDYIYTKSELVQILDAIDEIESQINSDWTPLEKSIFVYDKLKRDITYDPKFEQRPNKEIRTLRSLVSKKAVCAGYAFIYKEILERQNIECEYIVGGNHAWNAIVMDGKKYPLDLTWENCNYRTARGKDFYYFAYDIEKFNKDHQCWDCYKENGKDPEYFEFDREEVKRAIKKVGIASNTKEYTQHVFEGKRNDGSQFKLAQIGTFSTYGEMYRYIYMDEENMRILYTNENMAMHINNVRFDNVDCVYKRHIGYQDMKNIYSKLFSKENIESCYDKNTSYLGYLKRNKDAEIVGVSSSREDEMEFSHQCKNLVREDGTKILVEEIGVREFPGINTDVRKYHVYEYTLKNGKPCILENVVYTETDLLQADEHKASNILLSRANLEDSANFWGGYLGYLDNQDRLVTTESLVNRLNPAAKNLTQNVFFCSRELKIIYEQCMSHGSLNLDENGCIVNHVNNLIYSNDKIIAMGKMVEFWASKFISSDSVIVTKSEEQFFNIFFDQTIKQFDKDGECRIEDICERIDEESQEYGKRVYDVFKNKENVNTFIELLYDCLNSGSNNKKEKGKISTNTPKC